MKSTEIACLTQSHNRSKEDCLLPICHEGKGYSVHLATPSDLGLALSSSSLTLDQESSF